MCDCSVIDFIFVFLGGYLVSYFWQTGLLLTSLMFCSFVLVNKMFGNYLHKYRDMLRKPNTNVHAITIYGVPVVDFIITLVGASVLSYVRQTDLLMTFIGSLILGEFLHYVFGVNTRFFNYIGIYFDEKQNKKE